MSDGCVLELGTRIGLGMGINELMLDATGTWPEVMPVVGAPVSVHVQKGYSQL